MDSPENEKPCKNTSGRNMLVGLCDEGIRVFKEFGLIEIESEEVGTYRLTKRGHVKIGKIMKSLETEKCSC